MALQTQDSQPCLKLCVDRWWPHLFVKGDSPPYNVTGPMVEIMDIVAAKFNFCTEYVVPEDRVFGSRLPNGTWSGMMGLLVREEVNMSGVVFSVNEARAQAVDFSFPLYMDAHVLSYRRPVLEPDVAGFIWSLLLMAVMAILLSTFCIQHGHVRAMPHARKASSKPIIESKSVEEENKESLAWYSCLWTLTALLAQSCAWMPQGDSVRVITGLWLLVSLVVNTVYRSNLKAMLILPRIRLPFENLRELLETDLQTYVIPGGFLDQAILDSSEDSLLYQLKPQLYKHKRFHQARRDVVAGRYVGFLDMQSIVYIIHRANIETGECPLYTTSDSYFASTSLSLPFPKGSPLKDKLDPILQNLKEFGILDHIFLRSIPKASECLNKKDYTRPDNNLRSLELEDFHGVFFVYSGGMLAAVFTFIVELCLGGTPLKTNTG